MWTVCAYKICMLYGKMNLNILYNHLNHLDNVFDDKNAVVMDFCEIRSNKDNIHPRAIIVAPCI